MSLIKRQLLFNLIFTLLLSVVLISCTEDQQAFDVCEDVKCGENAFCGTDGLCVCDTGYEPFGKGCVLVDTGFEPDGDFSEQDNEFSEITLCDYKNCPPPKVCESEIICDEDSGDCVVIYEPEGTPCNDTLACNGLESCDGAGVCVLGDEFSCDENAHCDEAAGACVCDKLFVLSADLCIAKDCSSDLDCDDSLACNGLETCSDDSKCVSGEAITCTAGKICFELEDAASCKCPLNATELDDVCKPVSCVVPQAITLTNIHEGALLEFSAESDLQASDMSIELAITNTALKHNDWIVADSLAVDITGLQTVYAKIRSEYCVADHIFSFTYNVMDSSDSVGVFPPRASEQGTTAIAKDDPLIVAWATGFVSPVQYGTNIIDTWKKSENALGAAQGTSSDIVSLGRGGQIVLTFEEAIKNGEGYDFAVFENSFDPEFLELAYVEVSSDGQNFLRFDSVYLGETPVSAYGYHDPKLFDSLAGKYIQGFGTPFDLEVFKNDPDVLDGSVNLDQITHIKIVDIIGDGSESDSFGNPIYDPYPTIESAGFDLDGVGVINK